MDSWNQFLCRHLGHHRARKSIQFNSNEQHYESVCQRCRIKMVRTREGEWRVAGELAD